LHARLDWATLLHNALNTPQNHSQPAFKSAVYDAITSIESPCNIIFDSPLPVPPRAGRPPPRQKHTSARQHSTPSFLYIKSSALGHTNEPDELYLLLRCPQCLRTTFTTLQGLLNHARIAHHLEWGTHEECVRACAVIEPDIDTSTGVEVGLGPAGILPGLRSIFQMAVDEMLNLDDHITKMLGLHEDTPALAPFLGKSPIRRGIKVYGLDDITDDMSHQRRLPLRPRNTRHILEWEQELQANSVSDRVISPPVVSHSSTSNTTFLDSTRSRFHFNTRIVVTDRSLWIPPDCREEPYEDHTHKWMVSVHSPSYAFDLTTILKSITVTPAHGLSSAEAPPYVVVGTAKYPFLARISLLFNGIGCGTESPISNAQRVVLEHWVELDPLKTTTPVNGEEQTIDVELDKRTVIGSVQTPLGSKVLWDSKVTKTELPASVNKVNEGEDVAPEYIQMLNLLLPSFPMTKESRTGRPTDVPYKLAQTHAQFQSLNLGRRKAIEWRRAGALQNAYVKAISGYNHDRFPSLTTGDIYSWLADNGHFLRQSTSLAQKSHPTTSSDSQKVQHCPVCGLTADAHSLRSDAADNPFQWDMRCFRKTREFPLIDSKDVITTQISSPVYRAEMSQPQLRSLLQASDPSTIQAVQAMVENLTIPMLYRPLNDTRVMTETEMAPYALLGLTMQLFVRTLVQGGLEMLHRDMEFASSIDDKTRRQGGDARRIGMLTPAHIFDGIMARKDVISKSLERV
ncbi:hypothetical protein F5887DRAFT_948644, partial [Amanita rubescens]